MSRPMFPHAVDSTMLASFASCPQKMFRTYVQHWKPQNESVHLIAGGAFASGIEAARDAFFVRGLSAAESETLGAIELMAAYGDFTPPDDSAKTLERMLGALDFYFENYPLGADGAIPIRTASGRRGIEFSFAEPLPVNHPVTGDPILFTGRADMIADFAGGRFLFDEKTTSSLGASWAKQWDMRSQFTGYVWACQKAGIPVQGAIVRGISILKSKYETQQVITYRSPHLIDLWLNQVVRMLNRMIECWKEGYWDYDLNHACVEYGGCSLTRVCASPEPESWLPVYFTKRVWDPLLRQETSIEEWEASWGNKVE